MKFTKVSLRDAEGNEIKPPLCKCGNPSDTCIMGVTEHQWTCNKCLYPQNSEAKLIYKKYDDSRKITPSHLDNAFSLMLKEQSKGLYRDKEGNEIDLWKFADLMEDMDYRHVLKEQLNDFFVSTVWLGVKHSNDCFFETAVFIELDGLQCGENVSIHRYESLGMAEMGHHNIVRLLQEGQSKFPGDNQKIIQYMEESIFGVGK